MHWKLLMNLFCRFYTNFCTQFLARSSKSLELFYLQDGVNSKMKRKKQLNRTQNDKIIPSDQCHFYVFGVSRIPRTFKHNASRTRFIMQSLSPIFSLCLSRCYFRYVFSFSLFSIRRRLQKERATCHLLDQRVETEFDKAYF